MTLPIVKLLAAACVLTWERRETLFRVLRVPLALGVLLSLARHVWGEDRPGDPALILWVLPTFLLTVMLAVRTYRVFLLGRNEHSGERRPWWSIRETRFLFAVLGISVSFMLAAFVTGGTVGALWPGIRAHMNALLGLALILPAGYVASRLLLAFPAIAVEEGQSALGALRAAWLASRNNGWRILILCVLVPGAVTWLVAAISLLPVPGIDYVAMVLVWLLLPAQLSILALAYAQLARPNTSPGTP